MNAVKCVAVLRPDSPSSPVSGVVHFLQPLASDAPTRVWGRVAGLAPRSAHALRVMLYGDESAPRFRNLGGVYNPFGREHALPDREPREEREEDESTSSGAEHVDGEEAATDSAAYVEELRPAGALGNIEADDAGVAQFDFEDGLVRLVGPLSVIGRSIGVALGEDRGAADTLPWDASDGVVGGGVDGGRWRGEAEGGG